MSTFQEYASIADQQERPEARSRLAQLWETRESTIIAIAAVTIFLAVWELIPHTGLVKPLFTSSPSRIIAAAQWLFANGFWHDIVVSATEFALGFGLAALIAIPLGVFLGWYRRPRAAAEPFISALYATPRIALVPIIILWLGIGIESKVAVVFLGAFFPILVSVMMGMRTIDEQLLKCARAFGASDRQVFSTLAMPGSVPFIVTGMRLGVGRALVGVIVAELVASTAGIGHMMTVAGATFQTDKVFVGVVILSATGVVLTEAMKRIERRVEAWRPDR
ncbi:MAG: ABC transporter permease [Caldilineales bacterium]|nr:ABC transporter permease [Caldilineales bacterium]